MRTLKYAKCALPTLMLLLVVSSWPSVAWTQSSTPAKPTEQRSAPAEPENPFKQLGQFSVVSPINAVPTLAPLAASDQSLSPEARQRLGFGRRSAGSISLRVGQNPNVAYQQVTPYPEMVAYRHSSVSFMDPRPGIEGVRATRSWWQWPPPNPDSIPEEQRRTVWDWKAPQERRSNRYSFADTFHKRYGALCLSGEGGITVFCFDSTKGLRWQANIPDELAVRAYRLLTKAGPQPGLGSGGTGSVYAGVSHDGSRVLVAVGRSELSLTLLFVFDGAGKLLHTRAFPNRLLAINTGQIQGAPTAHWFALNLAWNFEDPEKDAISVAGNMKAGSYLVDGDGNVLGLFRDTSGTPITVGLSDTHATAWIRGRVERDAGASTERIIEERTLVYELPAAPQTTLSLPTPANGSDKPGATPAFPSSTNQPRLPTEPPPNSAAPNKR